MNASIAALGEKYYQHIGNKNIEEVSQFLDPSVEFFGPLAHLQGKKAVLQATENFIKMFQSLTIKAKFGSDDQAMIVYEVNIPGMAEKFPGASLLSFRDGLIVRVELFYDGSRFIEKKEKIFQS